MSQQFRTEAAQMLQSANQVDQVNASVTSILSSLRAEVDTARGHFHGGAAANFQQMMMQYNDRAMKLNQALSGISELIKASSKAYTATDEQAAQGLKSAGSALNIT